jgi:hypothetical protein
MPRPPLFESPLAQRSAVAVAVGLVLLLATGTAYFVTTYQATPVPGAVVQMPRLWQQIGRADEPLAATAAFAHSQDARLRLAVTPIQFEQTVEPTRAIAEAQGRLPSGLETHGNRPEIREIETPRLTGLRYEGQRRIRRGPHEFIEHHMVTALTADGRNYWILHVSDLISYTPSSQALAMNRQLIRRIERSLTPTTDADEPA